MEAKLLCFNLEGTAKGETLAGIFTFLGYQVRHVKKEEYGQTLGMLVGLSKEVSKETVLGEITEEMMVIHATPEKDLDQALFLMKEEGVRVDLKAMTTENNLAWTPIELFQEIHKEREMIKEMESKRKDH